MIRRIVAVILSCLIAAPALAVDYRHKLSSTDHPDCIVLLASSDHLTELTGASVTCKRSRDGEAAASCSGAVSEFDSTNFPGMYCLAGNATDRGIQGQLRVRFSATGADPKQFVATITTNDPNTYPDSSSDVVLADANKINGVSTSSVTTINANIGSTQPVNFTGTSSSALVKSDAVDIAGTASAATAGYCGVDWAHLTGASTSNNLSATTVNLTNTATTCTTATTATTCTNITNAPTNGDFTAAMKTSLNASTPASITGACGSVTGAVGSVTGNVGGNVVGSCASVTADVGITQAGADKVWSTATRALTDKSGFALTQAFPSNFSSLLITAGGHITFADTITTYTGNTLQTGDSYARLGAPAGASHAADIAAVKALLPAALVGGRMDSSVGAMATDSLSSAAVSAAAVTKIAAGISFTAPTAGQIATEIFNGSTAPPSTWTASNTAGAYFLAKLGLLSPGAITLADLVTTDETLHIVPGSAYTGTRQPKPTWTVGSTWDLTSSTPSLVILDGDTALLTVTGTVTAPGTSAQLVAFSLTAAQTALLTRIGADAYQYRVDATWAADSPALPARLVDGNVDTRIRYF